MIQSYSRNFWKLLIMIAVFTLSGIVFQKKEYYLFTGQFGYLEADKKTYNEWYNNQDKVDKCKVKNIFNLPIAIILAGVALLVFDGLQIISTVGFPKDGNKRALSLKEYSNYYFEKGFNIVPIQGDLEGNNVTRDSFKSPKGDWSNYKFKRQSKSYIESIGWKDATGIGAIAGINNLICIDIDECKNFNFVNNLIKSLGLNYDYPWVIRSGSGSGYHIWLRSKSHIPSSFPFFADPVIKFQPKSQFTDLFKQIEIRMNDHVVLPPSINAQGRTYDFISRIPDIRPSELEVINIINEVGKYALAE